MSKSLTIGILGLGHLGKIHLRCLSELTDYYNIVGFFDPNPSVAAALSQQYGLPCFPSAEALISEVEVVDIVSPTPTHFALASLAIKQKKHVFIEKPVCSTLAEALELQALATTYGVKGQVGFVERFNPAFLALEGQKIAPRFIEAHRLSLFNPRGTEVSVVLDLMIHDLDILLKLVKAPVREVKANGVAIVSPQADIVNARIEFEDSTVANITASRMSLKNMRKFRLFQSDAYISLDFLEKKTEIVQLFDTDSEQGRMELDTYYGKKYLELQMPETLPVNAIKTELQLFAQAILEDKETTVTLEDGAKALALAERIMEEM